MVGLIERWLWRNRSCSCPEVADVCVGIGQVPQPGLGWLGEGEGRAVEGCQTDLEINSNHKPLCTGRGKPIVMEI